MKTRNIGEEEEEEAEERNDANGDGAP